MTTIEYMEKQIKKHRLNIERAKKRNATIDEIESIRRKIFYYTEAVTALKGGEGK